MGKSEINWKKFYKSILFGTLGGLILAVVLLIAMSWGISNGAIVLDRENAGVILIAALAAFMGTLIASASGELHGLLLGFSVGVVMSLIQLLAGFLLSGDITLNGAKLTLVCSSVVGGGAAGIIGGKRKKGRRLRKNKQWKA